MKISKKVVNGISYTYAAGTIYINKGIAKHKYRSLGPSASMSKSEIKQLEFLAALAGAEVSLRVKYWEKKAGKDFLKFTSIKKIEALRVKLNQKTNCTTARSQSPLSPTFLIDFIYNSNRLEGSRVPIESIEKIVLHPPKKEKNEEVQNTINAIRYINSLSFKLNRKHIEILHDILLAHEPSKLRYRINNHIVVGNSPVSDHQDVKRELAALLAWHKKINYTLYPPEHAFTFYYRFERIHPFSDSNGRVGRLLMNKILESHHYHPIIIWNTNDKAHMHAFEQAMEGKHFGYFTFMTGQLIKTYEQYLKSQS